ncbi:TPA: hypothetical protein DHW62_02220 [candidate division WWE3 bacterium]|uniref:Uncharacterized protein n=1 Tax=candidate division WWE3 bacterium TaxID=2053526 RepID=A0A656PMN5_UNCKA|nr:hypothetical protein P147_WWE3C00001G0759 [candidate division WWE3 bacterium RAAC2_WWE3_1]KKS29177.1 MAG: hypothetical protein UU91_C0008G0041 [candidate division WWE3 bacterium GW2011_GWB1_42_117]KKS54757.1 MAG: hypothetical protein UV21_C0005G0121 [candidate division WWE3 bacterium GW2011_GWD2_42_34]KKT05199.1 MAG: hypothetical protein UV83_C0006G0028 [candidate division WWE3 bacterium GW2011_GWE2_43_18]KKT06466.1 MAG: hypothetical protein UV84_C0007G0028 [candidate division WWE3 bacterium
MSEEKFLVGDLIQSRWGIWGIIIAEGVALLTDSKGKIIKFYKSEIPKEAVKSTGDQMLDSLYMAFRAVATALDLPEPPRY